MSQPQQVDFFAALQPDADAPTDDDTRLETNPSDQPPALVMELCVRDPDVVEALWRRDAGRDRDSFALDALRVGVLALRHASSQIDSQAVRDAGAELLRDLQGKLDQHTKLSQQQTAQVLGQYFDPKSGRFSERVAGLVSEDGELARLLRGHLAGDTSPLARTLAETLGRHVGGESPLMKLLDPEQARGVVASLKRVVDEQLRDQRERVLKEFSLDNRDGALRRLVNELTEKHGEVRDDLEKKIDEVRDDFSLDKEDSALSRLVRNVDRAQRTISEEFSLDSETSGLSRLKKQLMETLESHIKDNHDFQRVVTESLAKLEQKRKSDAASPEHGNVFEEAVHQFIQHEAAGRGDLAEATGATTGVIAKCKVGDTVLSLGPDTPAAGARIVLEAKAAAGYTVGKALAELETARKNRRADLGVFVFAAGSEPTGQRPLARYRNDLVVIWNPHDPATDAYLLAAIEIARALAIEFHRGDDAQEVDVEGIEKAVNSIEKAAGNYEEIRKPAETIKSSSEKILNRVRIDQAALERQVSLLREKLKALKTADGK
ncbi:MAG: hypothetical protein AAGJ46_02155 [Planctomycetota bacterium]